MTKTQTQTKQTNTTKIFDSKNLFDSITKELNSNDIYKKNTNPNNNPLEQKTNRVRLGVFVVVFILIIFYMILPHLIEVLTSYITINA